MVEARGKGTLSILFLSVASHGDEQQVLSKFFPTELIGNLIAVHAGQPDVEQKHVRTVGSRSFETGGTVVCCPHLMFQKFQQPREPSGHVDVVVDDQDT